MDDIELIWKWSRNWSVLLFSTRWMPRPPSFLDISVGSAIRTWKCRGPLIVCQAPAKFFREESHLIQASKNIHPIPPEGQQKNMEGTLPLYWNQKLTSFSYKVSWNSYWATNFHREPRRGGFRIIAQNRADYKVIYSISLRRNYTILSSTQNRMKLVMAVIRHFYHKFFFGKEHPCPTRVELQRY
jgi:hypothetical protein